MKNLIAFTFLFLNLSFSTSIFSQNNLISNADLEQINVDWKGKLTYLNYQDDKSTVDIPCSLKTQFKKGKLKTEIIFDELDKKGKKMVNKGSFKISKDGQYLCLGKEKWKILSSEKKTDFIKIVSYKKGEDNDRPADLTITLIIKKDESISWKKDVRYKGTKTFFNRNQFSFSKN